MPESLTAPARDALAAATELADLLHETDSSDWPESRVATVITPLRRYLTSGHSPSFSGRNACSAGIVARIL